MTIKNSIAIHSARTRCTDPTKKLAILKIISETFPTTEFLMMGIVTVWFASFNLESLTSKTPITMKFKNTVSNSRNQYLNLLVGNKGVGAYIMLLSIIKASVKMETGA